MASIYHCSRTRKPSPFTDSILAKAFARPDITGPSGRRWNELFHSEWNDAYFSLNSCLLSSGKSARCNDCNRRNIPNWWLNVHHRAIIQTRAVSWPVSVSVCNCDSPFAAIFGKPLDEHSTRSKLGQQSFRVSLSLFVLPFCFRLESHLLLTVEPIYVFKQFYIIFNKLTSCIFYRLLIPFCSAHESALSF